MQVKHWKTSVYWLNLCGLWIKNTTSCRNLRCLQVFLFCVQGYACSIMSLSSKLCIWLNSTLLFKMTSKCIFIYLRTCAYKISITHDPHSSFRQEESLKQNCHISCWWSLWYWLNFILFSNNSLMHLNNYVPRPPPIWLLLFHNCIQGIQSLKELIYKAQP